MGWIKITGQVLEYTGKLAQAEGFEDWAKGVAADKMEAWASEKGIKFFKNRQARGAWWNELRQIAERGELRSAIEREVQNYQWLPALLTKELKTLPADGSFNRVVAVPRFLHKAIGYTLISKRLGISDELVSSAGGELLIKYFIEKFVKELDEAMISIPASTKRPVKLDKQHYVISMEAGYQWHEEPPGNYYIVETFGEQLSPSESERCEEFMRDLKTRLGRVSREEKDEMRRRFLSEAVAKGF
jgi:hypothetical protein